MIIKAPVPKKEKQLSVLKRSLENFKDKTVMEDCFLGFKELSKFKVNTDPFKKRVLASAFLEYCRIARPKEVVILKADSLAPAFYSALAPYVGKIHIPQGECNAEICRLLLSRFGTPIIFSDGNGPALCLGPPPVFTANRPLFCYSSFENRNLNFDKNLPLVYKKTNPLVLSAAMCAHNNKNTVFEFWKNLVIKENMIYNNYD